jgi:hypothetical protein
MVTKYKKNLNGYPAETYVEYVSPQTLVRPCSTKKLLTSELKTYKWPLFFREWTQLNDLAKSRTRSRSLLLHITILTEWLRHFNDLSVGETAAPAIFLRENAEGAGMPPLLSLRNDQTRVVRDIRRSKPRIKHKNRAKI